MNHGKLLKMQELLKKLVAESAALSISVAGWPPAYLADAVFLGPHQLWFCHMWPENDFAQHWIDFDEVTENHGMLDFKKGEWGGTIAPFDPWERRESFWDEWIGDRGRELRKFVEEIKGRAMAEKGKAL